MNGSQALTRRDLGALLGVLTAGFAALALVNHGRTAAGFATLGLISGLPALRLLLSRWLDREVAPPA